MVNQADEPLTKVTLNLFEKDVEWFKEKFGQGWQTNMREALREYTTYYIEDHNG